MRIIESYLEILEFNTTWLWKETDKFELSVVYLPNNDWFFTIQMGIWGYGLMREQLDKSLLYEPYYSINIYFLRSML